MNKDTTKNDMLDKIVSLAKRRGFVFQGSEIYGGLAGTWDYGPHGAQLAYNIKDMWWKRFVVLREDMYGLSSSLVMPEAVWEASGHLKGFSDPVVSCEKCGLHLRGDQLRFKKDKEGKIIDANKIWICESCDAENTYEPKTFNLMFPITIGADKEGGTTAYLRGELAQGMFVNFKNIIDSFHPKLPFGIAQIGKVFRNEIAPRDFLFRVREFDLAEFEYFVREDEWEKWFEYWRGEMWKWIEDVGIDTEKVHEVEIGESDRAHYSKRTIDFEFDFPFGQKELYGLAYRTDYDLKNHIEKSGVSMEYTTHDGERFIPHVIEPTFGIGRTILAVFLSAYREDEIGGEKRVYLKFKPEIAPVKVAVFPLLRNKPELVKKAREVYEMIRKDIPQTMWDDNGNIGKRYRRQDEIGTPRCVTIDFDTLEDDTVTVRDRDTGKQKRVSLKSLNEEISNSL